MRAIWCLFSVENAYDQPLNNLVAWWIEKPFPEELAKILKTDKDTALSICASFDCRIGNTDYRLVLIPEGAL